MNEETIIYRIYEDLIQSGAEANIGRELTETELKRLPCVFMESEAFNDSIYCALVEAAREAMEEKGWEEWDKMYADKTFGEI